MSRTLLTVACILLTACTLTAQVAPLNEKNVPRKVQIEVPFSPQAPHANWDEPYQEACEEMALIMVHHFLEGTGITSPEQADEELLALIQWEEENGYPQDVTLSELGMIANEYYRYKALILEDVSEDSIKEQLAMGNPVIVPAAGRELGNPYFSGEGPWYHMLVITGYTPWRFVTNDPGTRRGEDYQYKYEVLLSSIHNWTGVKEEITQGRRVALVLFQANISP